MNQAILQAGNETNKSLDLVLNLDGSVCWNGSRSWSNNGRWNSSKSGSRKYMRSESISGNRNKSCSESNSVRRVWSLSKGRSRSWSRSMDTLFLY